MDEIRKAFELSFDVYANGTLFFDGEYYCRKDTEELDNLTMCLWEGFKSGAESRQAEIDKLQSEIADLNNAYAELMDECIGYKRCLGLGYKEK